MMAEERLKHVGLKIHFDIIFLLGMRGVGGFFLKRIFIQTIMEPKEVHQFPNPTQNDLNVTLQSCLPTLHAKFSATSLQSSFYIVHNNI